jgi:putative glutamine amidotransferase
MEWAFQQGKPMLGICRGFQLLNVFFGGKMYQDLVLETGTTTEHRNADLYDRIHHEVVCTESSLLEKIYAKKQFTVNTVHHQGVKILGQGLVVDAHSPTDGIIEAFHHQNSDQHLVMGVQWHPEFSHTLGDRVIDPQPLLNHFLGSIRK